MNETMLENGLDFILDAAKQLKLAEETKDNIERNRAIKYSLLHLLSGIELVMKARLFLGDWTYIFADMNKANKKDYINGNLKTVEYSNCVDRLERLCGLTFTEKDKKAFEDLRKRRNCVEHFKVQDSVYSMETVINHALSATMNFLHDNNEEFSSPSKIDLNDSGDSWGLTDAENKLMDEITSVVATLKKHYLDAVKYATDRADKQGLCLEEERVECPSCGEKILVPNEGNVHCYLCGYETDGEMAARAYLSNVKNLSEYRIVKYGGTYPIYTCPECGKYSYVDVGDKYQCLSCRQTYLYDMAGFCSECGEPYWKTDKDWDMCPNCKDYKMEKLEET